MDEKAKTSHPRTSNPNRGSKPGERRGGRQKGTPNKITADIRELAREYGPDALGKIAALMESAESENVRMAAAREILDRAYGKATAMHERTAELNLVDLIHASMKPREGGTHG